MALPSFLLPANGAQTPESIARRRAMAQAMMGMGMDASPISSPWQGAARMAQALVGGLQMRRADQQEAEGRKAASEALIRALSGGDANMVEALNNPFMSGPGQQLISDAYQRAHPDQTQMADAGLNLVYWTDANGRQHAGQPLKSGGVREVPLPEGSNWAPGVGYLDTGTGFVPYNRRTGVAPDAQAIPKDLAGAEQAKELGQQQGRQQAAAPGDIAAADMALSLIADIENDPNKGIGTGFTSFGNAIRGTPGFDFQNKVDQATSGAFLTAIQQMRGLGSLSNAEGTAATQAVTRMNTATSEEAFNAALADYRRIVTLGKQRAQARLGQTGAQSTAPAADKPSAAGVPDGVDPSLWQMMTPEEKQLWAP